MSRRFDPDRLDRFVASPPKRLSDAVKRQRTLNGTRKQSREWLAEHLADQKGRCAYCRRVIKADNATLDHIVALARGGLHDRSNTCAACQPCNAAKGAMSVEEFMPLVAAMIEAERAAMAAYWRSRNARAIEP